MQLGFKEGWAGRRGRIARCPNCSSDRARYSRRHYDGLWFLVFRVRPVKCSDCGSYFPIALNASIRRPETDPADLHLPFRPSELREFEEDVADDPGASPGPARFRACPSCGSRAVNPSGPGGESSIARRLDVRTTYRCGRCNASFTRLSPQRLALLLGALFVVLGGLSHLATSFLGRDRKSGAATIQKDKIQPPPPPVFR